MGEEETVNEAFYERNMLALMLADGYYWHDGWKVLVINSIEGQLTFHIPPDFDTFDLQEIEPCWDGHTTQEKWVRVKLIIKNQNKIHNPKTGNSYSVRKRSSKPRINPIRGLWNRMKGENNESL